MPLPCTEEVGKLLAQIAAHQTGGASFQLGVEEFRLKVEGAEADIRKEHGSTPDGFDAMVNARVMKSLQEDAAAAQLQVLQHMSLVKQNVDFINKHYADDPSLGLRSLMVGSMEMRPGARNSASLAQEETIIRYIAAVVGDIEKAKLFPEFRNGKYDDDIIRAFSFLKPKEKDKASARSIKKNADALAKLPKEAVEIAEILLEHAESRRAEAISYGADIGETFGRGFRQGHETYFILRAASVLDPKKKVGIFSRGGSAADALAWVDYHMKWLDHDATFPSHIAAEGIEAKKGWLQEIFNEFRNGFVDAYTIHDPLKALQPGVRPAAAISKERVLHYTPEGAIRQMKDFGHGSVIETVMAEIDLFGHKVGLLSALGVDPQSVIKATIRGVKLEADSGSKAFSDFDKYTRGFEEGHFDSPLGWQYQTVTGATNRIVADIPALMAQALFAFQNWTKLGFAMPSSIADVGNTAAELQIQRGNANMFESIVTALNAPLQGLKAGGRRRHAESAGIGLRTMLGLHMNRLGGGDAPMGRINKMNNWYFKVNLLGPWTEMSRKGLYAANTNYMAKVLDDPFLLNNGRMREMLMTYGIGNTEMDFIRKNLPMTVIDGDRFMNPPAIARIPLDRFPSDIENLEIRMETQARMRLELEKKFRSFFIDRNDFGVLTPGAETRAMVQHGLGRGDSMRILREAFWQYKQFPLAMYTNLFKRNVGGKSSNLLKNANGELGLMASHIAMLGVLGAVGMTLKDIAKGREVFVPQTRFEMTRFFGRAMLNGGAMGLYGDFLMGGISDVGRNTMNFFGPAAGDAINWGDFSKTALMEVFGADQPDGKVGSTLWKAIRDDIPFANVFYSKLVLDLVLLDVIAEVTSDGYLARQEQGVKAQNLGRGHAPLVADRKAAIGRKF